MQNQHATVNVWDPLLRLFHWGLVAAFTVAYLTEDWRRVHVLAGYTVTGLIAFRILWGFIGSRHARFSDFIYHPGTVWQYLREIIQRHPRRYLGHNPVGGLMILGLIGIIMATCVTGMIFYAASKHAGPLAFWFIDTTKSVRHNLKEVHEFFANLAIVLVGTHILGVLTESYLHRENLTKSMFTGRKRIT